MTIQAESPAWPLRAWVLAAVGALSGLAIYCLVDGATGDGRTLRYATATFLGIGALVFGHGWTRGHPIRAIVTGLVSGSVVALVFVWNGTPDKDWAGGDAWRLLSAILAVFILVPLTQVGGDHGTGSLHTLPRRWSPQAMRAAVRTLFPYASVHDHGWTNLLTGGLSLLFAGLFYLMLHLLGALFDLVHVPQLNRLLENGMVAVSIIGGAIGAGTGLLRDRRGIIASLQSVAMTVLRVPAPVLAVALALFLAILPFAGLGSLWDATRSTTPILLSAAVVALLLANAVIGNGPDEEAHAPVLRLAAPLLLVAMTPLSGIAAVSLGLRVGQHGLTPERLWAMTFVAMACIVSLACLIAVVRGGARWPEAVRQTNLWLAILICGVAFILSTSLVRFDVIAARDQVARLNSGRARAEAFDYRELWTGFGPAGKAAIRDLAISGTTPAIRRAAQRVQRQDVGVAGTPADLNWQRTDGLNRRLAIVPRAVALPEALRARLTEYDACGTDGACAVYYRAGADWAVSVRENCADCPPTITVLHDWRPLSARGGAGVSAARMRAVAGAIRAGRVTVREERVRRVYIDGTAFGDALPVQTPQAP